MISLLLATQLAVSDSIYSTPSVRALVAAASAANRVVPESLLSYRARVESEVSLVLQPAEGPEAVGQVEQLENLVTWLRTGEYEQRVIGYRVGAAGLTLSSLSYARSAWTVPVLYGNRLSLFFGTRDTIADPIRRRASGRPRRDSSVVAIHPLSNSRERVYRFSGGDTVALIRLRNRSVTVRRIRAHTVEHATRPITAFHGEIDIDADRFHIVRMRGRFVTISPRPSIREQILRSTITPVAFVELVNAEVNERFWLPTYQRIEAQVSSVMTGEGRSVFRVISRFRDYRLNDVPLVVAVGSPGDTLRAQPHRLLIAPPDSLQRYTEWTTELGESGREARATDYDDLAPQQWKPTGPPRLEFRASRFSDVIRFNRVEGTYTGMGASLRFRDAFPGLTLRGNAGYAWSEKTVRGGTVLELKRRRVLLSALVARQLSNTNDFRSAIDGGATIPAVFASRDDYDYVDRHLALGSVRLALGDIRTPRALATFSAGSGSDRAEHQRLTKGVFGERYSFIQNRNVQVGGYRLGSVDVELNPEVTGESVTPGIGAAAHYEAADGDLTWQRVEARITARRNGRVLRYAARVDGGALLGRGRIPPQQLFELGGSTGLPGYDYKEFAGDRAVLGRAVVMAALPILRAPIRLSRRWFAPAPSPALSVGLQAGWADVSSARAELAVSELGQRRDARTGAPVLTPSGDPIPLSGPTLRVRSSIDMGIRFFGGALMIGVARPIDHHDNWRFLVSGSTF